MSTGQTVDLAGWLRQQPDEAVAQLLAVRPDLLHPVPTDVSVLAARAVGRSSVEIALDRLDAGALHVVEALALLADSPGAPDIDAVCAVLGAAAADIQAPLERVRDAALLWGSDDDLHFAPVIRDLMPTPAGLGAPIHVLVEHLTAGRLARIVADLGLPDVVADTADDMATARRAAIAGLIESRERLDELVARAPKEAREVIDLLAVGSPIGAVPAARRSVDAATADSPVRWLLAHALLVAVDDYTVVLPREVGLLARGGNAFPRLELTPPVTSAVTHKPADVDAAAAGEAFRVVRLIESLLERWGIDPPPVLRSGGVGVREMRRTARELDVDDRQAALLVEVAHAAGLIAPDNDAVDWLPTTAYDLWLAKPVADRWALIASAWLTTTRVPALVGRREQAAPVAPATANALGPDVDRALAPVVRRDVMRLLVESPAGSAPTLESMLASLRWWWPRRGGRLRDELAGWSHEEAELLGLTGRGAISSFGRQLCQVAETARADTDGPVSDPVMLAAVALEPLLPTPLDHVLLQADMTAVAPGPLESELARELAIAADIESTGGATVFRFTDASIRRALDSGRSATDLHRLVTTRSRTPVPQPLTYLIDDVARRHGRIRVGLASAYLRCDDDAVLSEVLADRRVESLRLRRLAPGVVVSPLAPERVTERLRELGYAPAAETADGALMLRRPDARRAAARPRPSRRRPELTTPAGSVIDLAVKAIRGGDRAVTAARGAVLGGAQSDVLPHSASSETLAVLQDAVSTGRAVWIGYLNAQGQASNRIVEPQRLAGGYLTAFDYRRDEPRTFAVHRITGVAELTDGDSTLSETDAGAR